VFAQYPDDLLLAEATPFHRPSPFSGDGLYLISAEFSGCRPESLRERNLIFNRASVAVGARRIDLVLTALPISTKILGEATELMAREFSRVNAQN
jgi:hypothetical protein